MKGLNNGIKWTMAAFLLAGITAVPAMAEKTTPATDKNSAVPAVPRAIPDLIPYHKFDPPKSKLFDINKLTISGDLRVRPEFRNNGRFGIVNPNNNIAKNNTFMVQQWARLGFNYSISPDVTFFFQAQHSKNWGVNGSGGTGVPDANGTNGTVFARQAFMLVRNFLVPNLTIKAGRQLVVWGNHRMFGHFDWNNVGWSHDGLTANYKLSKTTNLQVGWLRTEERNCTGPTTGNCIGTTQVGGVSATSDADVIYVRAPMKVAGMVLEPTYIWHSGGTGGGLNAPRPPDQSRHTLGGRAVKKMPVGGARLDVTVEGYYQFGEIARTPSSTSMRTRVRNCDPLNARAPIPDTICDASSVGSTTAGSGRNLDISAYAFHIDAGLTLPVPMQPRLSAEFNTASGDGDSGDNKFGGFDQLYPTNHIHFGYMDRMSWKNMEHFAFGLQMRPHKNSHFEVTGHFFSLKEATTDMWYHAGQAALPFANDSSVSSDDIGEEIDVVYTHFFTPGNHVAWQIGGGVFFPGERLDQAAGAGRNASEQTWGYTQLWVNF